LIVGLVVGSNAMSFLGAATLVTRFVAQTAFHNVPNDIIANDVVVLTVSLALLWLILRTLERAVERSNQRATAALEAQRAVELQQHTLQTANADLLASNAQMSSLLNLVRDLETPVIPLLEGVLVLPLIGHVDTRRASELTTTALNAVHEQRARMVIVDITGVSVVDTAVAQRISHLAQAVRLLGARVLLTGIRSDVAHTIVAQGIDFSNIQTAGRLQDGIASVLSELNLTAYGTQKSAKLN
jgi:rsbT co-antagonist protein RsbR